MQKKIFALIALFAVASAHAEQTGSAGKTGEWYSEFDAVVTEPITWPTQTNQDAIQGGGRPVKIGSLHNPNECTTQKKETLPDATIPTPTTCEVYTTDRQAEIEQRTGKKYAKYRAIALDDDNRLPPAGAEFVGSFKLERGQGPRMGLFRLK